jgi:hypothetical protein
MADEQYELLPHQLLSDLKYDVEALKKKLTQPDSKANELILEIESLKDSIHELHGIFKKALEKTDEEDIYKAIKRIDEVVSQNETIAKGMIAISDKLEDFMSKQGSPGMARPKPISSPEMRPPQHSMGPPPPPGPGRVAPHPPMGPPGPGGIDMPPPPPRMEGDKKRSLGGLFK